MIVCDVGLVENRLFFLRIANKLIFIVWAGIDYFFFSLI